MLLVAGGSRRLPVLPLYTTDVSICEGETDSAILAEPPKSQDGKRTLLSRASLG
jgi:hypothetical protein